MGITTIRNIKYTGCDSSILLRMQFYFLFVVIFAVLSPPISAKHGSEKRNNALSMKKLLARKARSDDIYGDVFVDPSAVFPVQVDLSTLLTVVNNRISSIEQEAADARQQLQDRLDSAEAKVEQLRTDIDAKTLEGSSFCQTGNVACDDCGGRDDVSPEVRKFQRVLMSLSTKHFLPLRPSLLRYKIFLGRPMEKGIGTDGACLLLMKQLQGLHSQWSS